MPVDEASDGLVKGVDAAMGPSSDLAVRQESEEAFDLVEP